MPVFDGKPGTEIVVAGQRPDFGLRSLGMLTLDKSAIFSPKPFQSTSTGGGSSYIGDRIKGVDCKVIHGDFWQQVGTGPSAQGNVTTDIEGNDAYTVSGDEQITVHGNLNQEVYGDTRYTYVDTTDTTHLNTVTANYGSKLQTEQPTSDWTTQATSYQAFGFLFQFAALQVGLNVGYIQLVTAVPIPIPGIPSIPALYITLIAGLNLAEDILNMQKTWGLQVTVDAPAKMTFTEFWAHIFGARVAAGGAQARAHATAGVPPHPPLTG